MRGAVCVFIVAAVLAGCGGDDQDETASPATPSPAATATPPATATPSATPTATATATATPQNPEDQPGGAGDEEPVRVPVEFTVRDRGISPPQVAVPAFLALELVIHNQTAGTVVARLEGAEPLTVGAGETGRARLEGRKKGQYVVDFGDLGQALLISGTEPGP